MVEQTKRRVRKDHPMFIGRLDALCIHHAPRRRREILHPAPARAMHIVRKREERIARARDALQLLRPLPTLLSRQRLRHALKQALPLRSLTTLEVLAADVQVDRVCFVCSLRPLLEGQRKHARVVSEPPDVSFGAREAGAVDARLLAGANANNGATEGIGDAVGLGVFEGESGNDEVGEGRRRELQGGNVGSGNTSIRIKKTNLFVSRDKILKEG